MIIVRLGLITLCALWMHAAAARELGAQAGGASWVGAWAMAPQAVAQHPAAPGYDRAPAVFNATVRQIIVPTLPGPALRLRLSNRFGTQDVRIDKVTVAMVRRGAAIDPATLRTVLFDGQASLRIPAGGSRVSDAVDLPVQAGKALAVSLAVHGNVTPQTWHKLASQVNFISAAGDHADDAGGAAFTRRVTSYLWLDGMQVRTPAAEHAAAVVAIGDSITDGMRSSLNADRRWPDVLARRLREAGIRNLAVLNAGISGNRLLHDSPCYGISLEQRFARDALDQPGVRAVIVLAGINDINFGFVAPHAGLDCDVPHVKVSAADLIAGYRALIAQAHARGVVIVGGTITPANLPPGRETVRRAVNAWIRHSHAFDGVIDFDAALRDPAQPSRLLPRFDSGDHVHPSDAGYAAMAAAVPLGLLQALPPAPTVGTGGGRTVAAASP